MNKVYLIGNLTKDPELNTTISGIDVCRFTLAVSRKYVGTNGERETDFLNIVVWRGQAQNCNKYLKKGNKVAIIGRIETRNYEAQDGSKKYITEIIADEVEFLNSKKEKSDEVELIPIDDDSIPF